MKARGISVSLLIILICATIFFGGCKSDGGSNSSSERKISAQSLANVPAAVAAVAATGAAVTAGVVNYFTPANLSSGKAITSYSLNGVAGTIDETTKTIVLTMPSLTNIYSLVATFTTTGHSVTIGSTQQVSGTTLNNFSSPLVYTVTAEDRSTVTYTVTVTVNRGWHHPTDIYDHISPYGGIQAYDPQVAMDDNGNAIIVWRQEYNIFKSEYRNGVWSHPLSLLDNISLNKYNAWAPQVAMDNNGNAIIVWTQYDGTNYQVYKSEYRNGVWHHPASLADNISHTDRTVSSPQVAMDDHGNAIIVWSQLGSNYSYIFKSEYRNETWTHPSSLTDKISLEGSSAGCHQVAMDDNGNAIIVWRQFDGTYYQIFKSEYGNGTWHHPANFADNITPDGETYDSQEPQLAMSDNDSAIIVWAQSDGTNPQVFKSEYRGGTWTNPSSLADNISPIGYDVDKRVQVAMDNKGNAIIVWSQLLGGWQVFKSEYRNGIWTHPSTSSDKINPSGSWAAVPKVEMDNNGDAIIIWNQQDQYYQIFKSEYRNGIWHHPASLSEHISPDDGGDSTSSQVAMDNNGNAVIVWEQLHVTLDSIYKSEYR